MRIGVDPVGIREASDAVTGLLIPPIAETIDQCRFCHQWLPAPPQAGPGTTPDACENCEEVVAALRTEPLAIAALSLYRKPSRLRDILTRYKGRDDGDDPFDADCFDIVRAISGRFFLEFGDELEELTGGVDGIVVVPSTDRPPPHPLEAVLASLEMQVPILHLLERGPGRMGFRQPAVDGFRVREDLAPSRILLVDDVYTTGARLNSAAAALRVAGHSVSAAVVLARRINPDYTPEAARLWDATSSTPFDWRTRPWT